MRAQPSWDAAVREHVIEPLGVKHTVSLPEEAILFRAAAGHFNPEDPTAPKVAPIWMMSRSESPAGTTLCASARDVISFARMHLRGGTAEDGTRVLGADSVAAMQVPHISVPTNGLLGDHWGLGWELFDWPGAKVIGHDGGTFGQASLLRAVPGRDVVLAVLTNGGSPVPLFDAAMRLVLGGLAGVEVPALPNLPRIPVQVDPHRFAGVYENIVKRVEIVPGADGRLEAVVTQLGAMAELVGTEPERTALVGYDAETLIVAELESNAGMHHVYAFPEVDADGRAPYVHEGARALMRVPD